MPYEEVHDIPSLNAKLDVLENAKGRLNQDMPTNGVRLKKPSTKGAVKGAPCAILENKLNQLIADRQFIGVLGHIPCEEKLLPSRQ